MKYNLFVSLISFVGVIYVSKPQRPNRKQRPIVNQDRILLKNCADQPVMPPQKDQAIIDAIEGIDVKDNIYLILFLSSSRKSF